ncbi:hypothetical protein PV325_004765 [Microctonus aethiopoides]|nr:hypothetical protein PV325_004765 [Microctonus aethiopoides]KAK0080256.1 hypothetical protein PV326_008271 [Microctonus aethiopoides]
MWKKCGGKIQRCITEEEEVEEEEEDREDKNIVKEGQKGVSCCDQQESVDYCPGITSDTAGDWDCPCD